jgi:hypothetical protein
MIEAYPTQKVNKNIAQQFIIDKILTVSLVDRKTGEIVYSAPYDNFAVVLSGLDQMKMENHK